MSTPPARQDERGKASPTPDASTRLGLLEASLGVVGALDGRAGDGG